MSGTVHLPTHKHSYPNHSQYKSDVATEYFWKPGDWPAGSEFPKTPPQKDIHHPNITCGRGAFASAATTSTADILAGSTVGFRVSWDGNGKYGVFWHPGPGQIYLSRPPDNQPLETYHGQEGDWFKIAYGGPVSDDKWLLWGEHDFNFTIPLRTPPGRYLMRIEQFMPTKISDYTQWYVNCAHVNIIGPGGGTPEGFAKFPGTYVGDEPGEGPFFPSKRMSFSNPSALSLGLLVPENQLADGGYVPKEEMRLLDYQAPGPALWTG